MRRAEHLTTWQEPTLGDTDPAAPARLDEYKLRRDSLAQVAREAVATESADESKNQVASPAALEDRRSARPVAPDNSVEARPGLEVGQAISPPPASELECFETLKANLWIRFPGDTMNVVLLVGATNGCGVSTAAVNFAASLAQDSGAKVLLIDANVRAPKQLIFAAAQRREANARLSLERLLSDASAWQYPSGSSNLYVLGAKCSTPLSVFRSEAFDEFLGKVRRFFKYVVIDAPAPASHPETLLLTQKADGVILVIESEKTRKQSALWAKKQIETAGGKLLGVVLNKRRYRIPNWLYKRI
jgi:protein-tyrosine kinase